MENLEWSFYSLLLVLIVGVVLMVAVRKKIKSQSLISIYALLFIFWLTLLLLVHLAYELQLIQQHAYFVALGYLQAPFFYFNIRVILRLPPLRIRSIYFHFLPLQLYVGILILQTTFNIGELPSWIKLSTIVGAFTVNYIYLYIAFTLVKKHQEYTLDYQRCQRLFTSFFTLLVGLVGCTFVYFLAFFNLENNLFTTFKNIFWLLITGAGYYLIYQFILKSRYSSNLSNTHQVANPIHPSNVETTKEKLEDFMHYHKPFVRHSLTIYTLAEMLNQKPAHLSWVINQCYKMSFSEYINTYRVKYFIEIVHLEEHRHRNLLGIALEIGFNSKNTFLRAFKKEYHTTPHTYFNDLEMSLK
ncbi:hypothetical protein BKI52_06385 [marine bacterium AO1-C]|nr:hypothetical protein BKI52_06385 [marine bacterium AO1-C]